MLSVVAESPPARGRGLKRDLGGPHGVRVSLLLLFDASNRLRAAAGRLASRILGDGIARIKARTLVACTPARLAIAAVLLSLSATALAAGQTTGSIEGAIVDPNGSP